MIRPVLLYGAETWAFKEETGKCGEIGNENVAMDRGDLGERKTGR